MSLFPSRRKEAPALPAPEGQENGKGGVLSELIGRSVLSALWPRRVRTQPVSYDETVPDYTFYDRLRRGVASGYQFGGLFIKALTQIVSSWEMGGGFIPKIEMPPERPQESTPEDQLVLGLPLLQPELPSDARVEYTESRLLEFAANNMELFSGIADERLALGNVFVYVSPGGGLLIPSPDTVEKEVATYDYRVTQAIIVTTKNKEVTIVDRWEAFSRTITWKRSDGTETQEVYENMIGRIPFVHFANDKGPNEIYGRPLAEPILHLISRYDDLVEAAVDGVELMGHPIATFFNLQSVEKTLEALRKASGADEYDLDNVTEERDVLKWDTLGALFVPDGDFKFVGPMPGFTDDVRNVLKLLFLIMLDHTRVPEFLWGGAIEGSRASAETQMPPWTRYVEWRQTQITKALTQVLEIWLAWERILDPLLVTTLPITLEWSPLADEDKRLTLDTVSWASGTGKLSDATALRLVLPEIDNPEEELEAAREESRERMEEFGLTPGMATFGSLVAQAQQEADQNDDENA